eukprot:gnl/TRDRNA2_/TRDRNA2_182630_c0_seq1.p1 gnl/TRDRNA2_/TRDRNA2_182630_c0~~gnl/TRDRNA2_/TRDRNA2_182630_c0_seq1.p1  ORF type:complete len:175 (+),score=21.28 gnl/TRDRNA2_/TRDRNA2_182630_c0_seq1:84-608(+)
MCIALLMASPKGFPAALWLLLLGGAHVALAVRIPTRRSSPMPGAMNLWVPLPNTEGPLYPLPWANSMPAPDPVEMPREGVPLPGALPWRSQMGVPIGGRVLRFKQVKLPPFKGTKRDPEKAGPDPEIEERAEKEAKEKAMEFNKHAREILKEEHDNWTDNPGHRFGKWPGGELM